jgi:endonuclease/exonuclease/phosphatase (EEP) superfamily protein YafD
MIVGGGFNTLTPDSLDELENQFKSAELERSTAEAGPSVGLSGVGLSLDQIFTKGFQIIKSGSLPGSDSSDHNPLWIELDFNN